MTRTSFLFFMWTIVKDLAECSLQLRRGRTSLPGRLFSHSVAFLKTKQSNSHHPFIDPFTITTDVLKASQTMYSNIGKAKSIALRERISKQTWWTIADNEAVGVDALPADLDWYDFESGYAETGGAKVDNLGVPKTPSLKRSLLFFLDQSAVTRRGWW